MLSQAMQCECGLPCPPTVKSFNGFSLPQEVQVYFLSRRQVEHMFCCEMSSLGFRIPHSLHSFVILHMRQTACIWPVGLRSKSVIFLSCPHVAQFRLASGRHPLQSHCAICVLRYSGPRGRGSSHPAPAHGGHKHASPVSWTSVAPPDASEPTLPLPKSAALGTAGPFDDDASLFCFF
jgi:hypothetical protein